jgi:hypothetical protein
MVLQASRAGVLAIGGCAELASATAIHHVKALSFDPEHLLLLLLTHIGDGELRPGKGDKYWRHCLVPKRYVAHVQLNKSGGNLQGWYYWWSRNALYTVAGDIVVKQCDPTMPAHFSLTVHI